MMLAVVTLESGDEKQLASFLVDNALTDYPLALWQLKETALSAESKLSALVAAFHSTPVDMILFPASPEGDELATRLAWRLDGSAVCQALDYNVEAEAVSKQIYGNALTATLHIGQTPRCLSLSRSLTPGDETLPASLPWITLEPRPQSGGLPPPVILDKVQHPLQSAKYVLATGQGAGDKVFAQLAESLQAEPGFTRQRVMAGGCDDQRMIGISGHRVAPDVCIIAGASGASAFMAGVQQSGLIVAINTDPAAPVFAAADVGIVGDAREVLTALAACVAT
ncbi:electron transfer flavoprotein [Enterobacteriaceae bacterium RIT691]|nr:electron transfer flavoprotein [Enterobacteriaceae bacterium RIT691]